MSEQEQVTVPVRLTIRFRVNGQPHPGFKSSTIRLRVPDELTGGTVRWRIDVPLADHLDRQAELSVRSVSGDKYPVTLRMDSGELAALLASEQTGIADVELPMRVEPEVGQELVRDQDGRAQGVVERSFAAVTWDRSTARAGVGTVER